MKTLVLIPTLLLVCNFLVAQKDIEFWFVAPEISNGASSVNYDQPVAFRFSTYDFPATVTVSQPANPLFPVQSVSISANSVGIVKFPPLFDSVENKPPNQVLNKGFLINSTNPITVYYEIIGSPGDNPELFSLKGKNALGSTFFVPFQNILTNSNDYTPPPHAAFDIVATEDNTLVTITPTRPIVGHIANVPFSIMLNRGQTYSAEASGQTGPDHPSGSKVVSTKPIAITIKDDLLDGSTVFGGFCDDTMGDQLMPIDKVGTKYVIQKGALNADERGYVIGTTDGTQVKFDGIVQGVINSGQTLEILISTGSHFVESSAPIYLYQMTGINCEVAGEVLPPLDCGGSSSIRFVRSTAEDFYLFLVTKEGNQGGFMLNGSNNQILTSNFQTVPGSNGEFVAAVIPFATNVIPALQSTIIKNSLGTFQMGFLNGGFMSGCRFGFFSDYGNMVKKDTSLFLCEGDTVVFDHILITKPGQFYDTISGGVNCDTLLNINVLTGQFTYREEQVPLCEGDTIYAHGIAVTQSGIYYDTASSIIGCDTIFKIVASANSNFSIIESVSLCSGDTFYFRNHIITTPGILIDTLPGISSCDTILTIIITLMPVLEKTVEVQLCLGDSILIDGNVYSNSTIFYDTLFANPGCDTVIKYIINKSDLEVQLTDTVFILKGLSTVLLPSYFSSTNVQASWLPHDNLDDFTLINPTATPDKTITYTLVLTDDFGCTVTDSFTIFVRVLNCLDSLYIPNVFSPNDDGINDIFTVFTNQECISKVKVLRVYDRWGELIAEKTNFLPNDISSGWDGRFRKQSASLGVYTYYVEMETYLGDIIQKAGSVTLVH